MADLRVLVLYYMVEAALVGFVGMALIGIRFTWKQFWQIGVVQGLAIYVVRGIYNILNINYGSHAIVILACFIITLRLITRQKWALCSVAAFLGFIILTVSEGLSLPVILNIFDLTYEVVIANVGLHIAMGYCSNWLVILLAIYLAVTKKALFNIDRFDSML